MAEADRGARRRRGPGLAAGPRRAARGVGAESGQARGHAPGGHRGQARQHGSGLRAALLVAAGLPERLQQARLRGRRGPVRPRPREGLEAGRREGLGVRPGRQRRLPQRRALHREGRGLHLQPAARREEQAAHAGVLLPGGRRGGAGAPSGALQPEPPLRSVPGRARPGHRDREREGPRREGPQALPHRHRALQVRGVGEGRPHHAGALGQVLPPGPALSRPRHLLRPRRRHRAPHRAADGALPVDTDGAAAAHPRARARARHAVLAGPAVLPLLPHAQREPAAAERQAPPPGHRLGARPHRDREARLLRLPHHHRRADPGAEPVGHRRQRPQGRARPREGQAAPRRRRARPAASPSPTSSSRRCRCW